MLKNLTALLCVLFIASCNMSGSGLQAGHDPSAIEHKQRALESWWSFFSDPVLDQLVTSALSLNAHTDAKFKAFPIDNVTEDTLRTYFENPRVNLVKNVVQDYMEYRYIQNQKRLLLNYMEEQEFTLRGTDNAAQMKVLEIELNALHERRDEFRARLDKLATKISSSTKLLPEYVVALLKKEQPIPSYDITPVFLEDTSSLFIHSMRLKAASALLHHKTQGRISEKEAYAVFPNIPLNRFFGVSDKIFAQSESPWRVSVGMALRSLQLDDLESKRKYEKEVGVFRDSMFLYMLDLERLLVGYTTLIEQSQVLEEAVDQAQNKDVYKARLAVLRADYEKAKTVADLFGALELY